jgi:hypothetical protein
VDDVSRLQLERPDDQGIDGAGRFTVELDDDLRLDHGEIGERVPSRDRGLRRLPVAAQDRERPAACRDTDDVIVGQDVPPERMTTPDPLPLLPRRRLKMRHA